MANELKIDVNGIQLSLKDSKTGGSTLIFIHPFPFNKTAWDSQFETLQTTNRVITFDIRGFGESTMENTTKSSIGLYADDLIQMMDNLKIEKAVVCGLSMGGYILLDAVERYPNRFNAIVLADTQCIADTKEQQQGRYDTIKSIEEKGLSEFTDKFIEKALSPNTVASNKDLPTQLKSVIHSNSSAAVTSGLSAMAQRNETCSNLSKIVVPALIITGLEDVVVPPAQSEFLAEHIPGARLEVIEKAGHLSNIEAPEAFNKLLKDFLSQL